MYDGILQYETNSKLSESRSTLVCRGRRIADGEAVVLRILKPRATEQEIARLRHEFGILSKLNVPGVVKAYGLDESEQGLVLALEDIGGESLDRILSGGKRLSLERFLELAAGLAETLAGIHRLGIIHKDINPEHIVYNAKNGRFGLIDFGIADDMPQRTVSLKPPPALEGTLAYISPEQTGRVNRAVDYRTDFYSLGITFYRLLTGKLPFEADDDLGMVHCHIAKAPVAPHVLDPAVPETISRIVMKLTAKTAEERYQSGGGLKADLEKCLRGLTEEGAVPDFEPGLEDFSDRLRIPQKLYGREREIGRLHDAFKRAAAGERVLFLVAGYAGVGKTALVHEMHRPTLELRGCFIEGKFDQLQRNLPYSGWVQAFAGLANYILMESEAELATWKQDILGAVRSSGRVLTDIIPNLELITGPQPAVPELTGAEAQNRFAYLFQEFVKAAAKSRNPLVVFLDDLQWIDAASLNLLQMLMTRGDVNSLLLVGAYRDNEVDAAHPLMKAVEELGRDRAAPDRLSLTPLSEEDVGALLSDTLKCTRDDSMALARLVHAKTDGNPFFLLQILRTLENEGLLVFDRDQRRWTWDVKVIGAKGITDNVVELMSGRMRRLPSPARRFLQRAACIGARFDLATLSVVAEEPAEAVLSDLRTALREGLIIASGPDYQFVHDRVQQAAYSLIPGDELKALHWKIGSLLLREMPHQEQDGRFFDIVNHLNIGASAFASREKAAELAELNRRAGRKAKASAAFAAALKYFEAGLSLLGEGSWDERYPLTLALHREAAEAACLCGRYGRMKELAAAAHRRAAALLDEIPLYETEMRALTAQGELLPSIRLGLSVLERLGMGLTEEPSESEVEVRMKSAYTLLGQRTIEGLPGLAPMTAPVPLACTSVLSEIGEPAYAASPRFFLVWASVMAELSLRHGNCALSPFAYAAYALALCATGEHVETGSRLARAAISLIEPLGAPTLRCRLLNIYGCTIQPWTEHLRNTLSTLQESMDAGAESGDFTSGSYAAFNSCTAAFFMGEPLDKLAQRLPASMEIIDGMRQTYIRNWVAFHLLAVRRLQGAEDRPGGPDSFDEERWLTSAREANDRCGLAYYFLSRLIACYLLGESRDGEIMEYLAEVSANQAGFQAAFAVPVSYFYGSLALLKHWADRGTGGVRENLKKLEGLALLAPMNFQHKCDLVAAELARAEGRDWQAAQLYEKAVIGARKNGFIQEEALAYELAACFFFEQGMEDAGRLRIGRAREVYAAWQAWAKVRALEARYPQWLKPETGGRAVAETSLLDLNTMMKAMRVITGEMELNRLLGAVMRIVIENAGAQSGFLLLPQDGVWRIAAKEGNGAAEGEIPLPAGIEESGLVSAGVVRFVARTKRSIVLDDASSQGEFINDLHIRREKTRSLVCAPLLSRGRLIGILYLVNNLTTRAFTPERVQLLEMLLSQAAISLENAGIYEALRDSEAKYRRIVDTSGEGIWALGPDVLTEFVNARMADMLGYAAEEMIGRPVTDFMFEEERPDHHRKMENRRNGIAETYERRFLSKDGRTIWTLASATPVFDDERRFKGSFAMFTDITERKKSEEALRVSEGRYRLGQKIGHIGSWVYHIQTDEFWGSDEAKRIYGFDVERDAFSTDEVEQYIPERERVHQALVDLIESDKPYNLEFEIHPRNSAETRIIASIAELQRDERGEPLGVVGVLQDITERKRAEDALRRSEETLRQRERLLNESQRVGQVGGWDWDAVNDAIWWSDEYYRICGFEPGTPPPNYEDHLRAYTPESAARLDATVKRAMESGEPYELDLELANPTPATRWIVARCEVKRGENGKIWGLRGTAQNITERKHAEEKLRALNDELEQRVKERTAELESKNRELERMNKLFVGRELRMIELKEKIKALESGQTQGTT